MPKPTPMGVAIKYLEKNAAPYPVSVYPQADIPQFKYKYEGSTQTYQPKIRIRRIIIEVQTLNSLKTHLKRIKAQARAVLKTGVGHRIVLVHRNRAQWIPNGWIKWNVGDIDRFIRIQNRHRITVLSLDPGKTNFGWAVVRKQRGSPPQVMANGVISCPLKSITVDVKDQVALFIMEIDRLVQEYQVTKIAAERFMARGLRGNTIELVNVMLGILLTSYLYDPRIKEVVLITAAQWKNSWNRVNELKEFYRTVNCVDHQVDAVGIGIYESARYLDEDPFSINFGQIQKSINKTNVGKIVKGRAK